VLDLVQEIVTNASQLYVSRTYDSLAINYTALACWDDMMNFIEVSLVTHDRGLEQNLRSVMNPPPATAIGDGSHGSSAIPSPEEISDLRGSFSQSLGGGQINASNPQLSPPLSPVNSDPAPKDPKQKGDARLPPKKGRDNSQRSERPSKERRGSKTPPLSHVNPPALTETNPSGLQGYRDPLKPETLTREQALKVVTERWGPGPAPSQTTCDLHTRHSIIMRSQLPQETPTNAKGGDPLQGESKSGSRGKKRLGASGRPGSGQTSDTTSTDTATPGPNGATPNPKKSVPHRRSTVSHAGGPSRTPKDGSMEKPPLPENEPAPPPPPTAEDLALQEEVSAQRQRRQELIELREKLNSQLGDKNVTQKGFVVDSLHGTVIPIQTIDPSAKKSDALRFNIPQPPAPAPPPPTTDAAATPRVNTGRPGRRGNAPTNPRPKEDQFFLPDQSTVSMVVEVPLANGVGIHESDGTQRKSEYQQPKTKVSRNDYRKIVQQHQLATQLEAQLTEQSSMTARTPPEANLKKPPTVGNVATARPASGNKAPTESQGKKVPPQPPASKRPQTQGGVPSLTPAPRGERPIINPSPDKGLARRQTPRSHNLVSSTVIRPPTRGQVEEAMKVAQRQVELYSPRREKIEVTRSDHLTGDDDFGTDLQFLGDEQ
jgi:hypothetical protein